MPIYEQSYRRYEAREPLRRLRFWPITREALRLLLARRAFLGLLIFSCIPLVVRVVLVVVFTRFPDAGRVLPMDGRMFGDFLNQQIPFVLLLTVFGGAGLIANDLRTGAILVYLSRPLTRRDYVLGKLGVLLAVNLAVTLLPGLVLYSLSLALAPEQFAQLRLVWIGPAIVAQSLLTSLVVSLVGLAISSLSRSAAVAGLSFAGILVGLEIARGVVWTMSGNAFATLLSFQGTLRSVANGLFGISDHRFDVPWLLPPLVLTAVAAACLAVLRARVRAVEIVR
jgi:ABC-2 type transport system permease protein